MFGLDKLTGRLAIETIADEMTTLKPTRWYLVTVRLLVKCEVATNKMESEHGKHVIVFQNIQPTPNTTNRPTTPST
jgi:hypothetical protein